MIKIFLKKLALAILVPVIMLGLVEAGLALVGFEKSSSSPILVRGQENLEAKVSPTDRKVLLDPELLWAFVPGINWDGITINEHGFRTRNFDATKPAGRRRVITLGDSCTAQGRPPYSDRLHELLQANPPTPESWEAFNMGVFGYSIAQGLRQFQRDGKEFEPDVVTIYFGWNDHWLHEKTDAARMAQHMGKWKASLVKFARHFRLTSALVQLGQRTAGEPAPGKTYRVPEPAYREALITFVEEIRSIQARPVIITAPRRELTETLVKTGHAMNPDHAEQAHDRYVEIARSVARDLAVPLIDLASEYQGATYDRYFSHDGIHFEDEGLNAIAERLHQALLQMFSREDSEHS